MAAIGSNNGSAAPDEGRGYRRTIPEISDVPHDLISDALPFGRLSYDGPNAVGKCNRDAKHDSRYDAVIRVYDDTGNVVETHEHKGDVKK